ncbi:Nucleoside-diphosphate-sugar epimerase [Frankia canadensis]|uniref:Nucleoside-diphosphate-sugar epimerase n=1 Tax=Frankia canadensis TaxID=1836972 RepID=A0A2I2KM06_9ACTN|nr:NAD-dependent epimerase/dehydratase family protein [Frankia canadensis]SNQ46698.1 Nucleoside-diphosphate-sugar epimerase [Frankia canadensis]SOU53988.1 Nucleoside-diphosphate-sugar epimerase [Frankia canadensis]
MHLLILGGTRFVGRAVVDAALAAGAEVTLFNRGRTAPGLYPHLETVLGDRTADLSALVGRHFDLVVDCAGYEPAVVARSVNALGDAVARYVFVSTVSVYADQTIPPVEGGALLDDDSYGGRKAACERVVLGRYGERALIARPGLIVGPHDPTERFAYWPRRFTRPGPILAPGDPTDPAQFIDVRDLATWLVTSTASGVYNTVGLPLPLPMGELLDICRTTAGSNARVVWRSTADLLAAGVEPWMGVPLWIGDPAWRAANLVDGHRARAHGLTTRPVAQTVIDVAAWDAARGPRGTREPLPAADEKRLLLAGS